MRFASLVLFAAFLAMPLAARADLIGDTIQVQFRIEGTVVYQNTVMAPGVLYRPVFSVEVFMARPI